MNDTLPDEMESPIQDPAASTKVAAAAREVIRAADEVLALVRAAGTKKPADTDHIQTVQATLEQIDAFNASLGRRWVIYFEHPESGARAQTFAVLSPYPGVRGPANDTLPPDEIKKRIDALKCASSSMSYATSSAANACAEAEAESSLVSAIVAYARDERERGREEAYSAPYMVVVSEWRRRALGMSAPAAEKRPPPTHRCKACGALWRKLPPSPLGGWSLWSKACGPCCDNVEMGEQIEAITGWRSLCDPGSMGEPAPSRSERTEDAPLHHGNGIVSGTPVVADFIAAPAAPQTAEPRATTPAPKGTTEEETCRCGQFLMAPGEDAWDAGVLHTTETCNPCAWGSRRHSTEGAAAPGSAPAATHHCPECYREWWGPMGSRCAACSVSLSDGPAPRSATGKEESR